MFCVRHSTFWAVVLVIVSASPSFAASLKTIGLRVRDNLAPDGTIGYYIDRFDTTSPTLFRSDTLIGPDGIEVEERQFFFNFRRFASLDELKLSLVGEWTLKSASAIAPFSVEEYKFTIAPFNSTDIVIPRPDVHTNATTPPTSPFEVAWSPVRERYTATHNSNISHEYNFAKLNVSFKSLDGSDFRFATWEQQSLNDLVAITAAPPNATYDPFFVTLNYYKSAEIRVALVPEPNVTYFMLLAAAVPYALSRRARSAVT